MIDVVEFFGLFALVALVLRMAIDACEWYTWLLLVIVVIEFGFIRYCATVRWHKNGGPYEGISLQFKKSRAPTAYILFLGCLFFQLIPSTFVLVIMAALFAIIGHVNVILIYLLKKDTQDLPVNYFSNNKGSSSTSL